MKLTDSEASEIVQRISQSNNEKVIVKSTVVIVGFLTTVGFAGLVLLWAYFSPGMVQFRDVLTTLLVGFGCTTLFYTSKTFQHNRDVNIYRIHLDASKADRDAKSSERQSEYQAKVLAFDLMKDWHSAEMIFHATRVRTFFETKPADIAAEIMADESNDVRQSIMVVLNYFERVSLAGQTKLADNALLKSYFRGLFYGYYAKLEPYIALRRKDPTSHRLFLQYTNIISQWRAEEN